MENQTLKKSPKKVGSTWYIGGRGTKIEVLASNEVKTKGRIIHKAYGSHFYEGDIVQVNTRTLTPAPHKDSLIEKELTQLHLDILKVLSDKVKMHRAELCRAVGAPRSTVRDALDTLEAQNKIKSYTQKIGEKSKGRPFTFFELNKPVISSLSEGSGLSSSPETKSNNFCT